LPAFPDNYVTSLTLLKKLRVKNILVFNRTGSVQIMPLGCVHVITVAMEKQWHINPLAPEFSV
jgi:purine nucleoside phosphorylase